MQFASTALNLSIQQHQLDRSISADVYEVLLLPCQFSTSDRLCKPNLIHIMWVKAGDSVLPNHIIPIFPSKCEYILFQFSVHEYNYNVMLHDSIHSWAGLN